MVEYAAFHAHMVNLLALVEDEDEHLAYHFHGVNCLAVLSVAVILWLLGWLWYSPFAFGKKWQALVPGPQGDKKKTMIAGMVMSLVGNILLCWVLDHACFKWGAQSFGKGLFVGFTLWMGFFAATAVPASVFEGRPFKLFAINQGYFLLALMVGGGILTVWR